MINRIISGLICAAAALAMTGCEKASDRTIYLTAPSMESQTAQNPGISLENSSSEELFSVMAFSVDGVRMCLDKLPCSALEEKGWTFDPAMYGLENLSAEKGCVYQRSVYLLKPEYDQEVLCVGFTNFNNEPCGIKDIQLWSIEFTAHGNQKYPAVFMDSGITWGSSREEVIKAYGEPSENRRNDDTNSFAMHYTDDKGSNVYFEVYDGEGVGKIILESYKV